MARLLPIPTAARAAAILREVFSGVEGPVAFRLWDGTDVSLSRDRARCTVAIPSPEAFLHLIRHPSPYHFAEAYVQGRIDLVGDLFSVMPIANQLEGTKLGFFQKIRLLLSLWKR